MNDANTAYVNSKYLQFDQRSPAGQTLLNWWRGLEDRRGERAALRRCRSLTEVVFVPAYHHLMYELSRHAQVDREGLAIVAGLAARVKNHQGMVSIAEQMAQLKEAGDSAKVSGLRFRRLLKIRGREELYPAMVRIIALLGGSVNLLSLANSAYWWNDRTRKDWAFAYYSKGTF